MKDLLYLAHRTPYPPNKGDKIRSYHMLKRLSERWNVHLGTFIDDSDDWQHTVALEEMCYETKFVRLIPSLAKLRALRAVMNGTSLTIPYYESAEMKRWVCDIADRKNISYVIAFSSGMAQYAAPLIAQGSRSIVDFCDLDSDKWRQYSEMFTGVRHWVYGREATKLSQEEATIASQFDASVLVSEDEATIFCQRTGTPSRKVHTVRNGVDVVYFDPDLTFADPFANRYDAIVFVGAMDYWPNVDAVTWFTKSIFPAIRARSPNTVFYIVGSNPTRDVLKLGRQAAVTVTGRVEDVRPYLRFSRCVVAPLRVARGVQNKVLEAMAMDRPVVATTAALEGIKFDGECGISTCDTEESWIDEVVSLLGSFESDVRTSGARRHVTEHYSWEASVQNLAKVVTGAT